MPDPTLEQALREAYASAPADTVILHTLELRHPAFADDDGRPTAIRVVRDHVDLTARLEATAPLDAAEMVRFVALAFELELPPVDSAPAPEISVTLDNVSREIVRHLDAAATSRNTIEVTYRPYLSTDLEGPQMDPPITLTMTEVEVDVFRATGRARMLDIGNRAFPAETYTAKRFPGLTRQMHWAEELIGCPWLAGGRGPYAFDCWGLVRFCWRTRFGIEVPEIPVDAANLRAVLSGFRDHPERERWKLVERAREGDAVLMRQSRHPVHVGIWLAVDGGGVLHAARDCGVVFQNGRDLTAHGWRIEGTYRFTGET